VENHDLICLPPAQVDLYVVQCPSLPGCLSQGHTKEEAIENIKDAIVLFIEALKDQGLPVPEEKFDSLMVAV
jgi:predicted RNase H-like HicB family nuclease